VRSVRDCFVVLRLTPFSRSFWTPRNDRVVLLGVLGGLGERKGKPFLAELAKIAKEGTNTNNYNLKKKSIFLRRSWREVRSVRDCFVVLRLTPFSRSFWTPRNDRVVLLGVLGARCGVGRGKGRGLASSS
jgi:hypothetical protein